MAEIQTIVMPKWGLAMQEGMLAAWHVAEGQDVTKGQEIAALKRRVGDLERELRRASRVAEPAAPAAANEHGVLPGTRFSARSMASQRKRLGLSAAECGVLIGASAQSIYNWEEGKARPRVQHLPAIYALRTLGRRQANEILESRKAA